MTEKLMLLNPGHGGKDPGAIYKPTGLREHDVVAEICEKVMQTFRPAGMNKILIQQTGKLQQVIERANRCNPLPAIFVSVHCNSSWLKKPRGLQVYYRDAGSERLARCLFGGIGEQLGNDKTKWAKIVQCLFLPGSGTNYGVLRESKATAAVLVETDFISNPEVAAMMAMITGDWIAKAAAGITNGLNRYVGS